MIDVLDLDVDDLAQMHEHAMDTALRGGDKSECPVAPNHALWNDWQRAWTDQRRYSEGRSGAMGHRTRLMKAEVRRQMEGLPEYGPDPTADVWPERHRGGTITVDFTVDPWKLKAAFEQARSFSEALERVNSVFASASTELAGLLGVSTAPAEPTVAQKRHGSAATCPRHGQTRGGTCMKCARASSR